MVGTALHWHTVPLPLPLLAGPWPGKTKPSAGRYMIVHHANTVYACSNHKITCVTFTWRIRSHLFRHRLLVNRSTLKYNALLLTVFEI